MKNILITFLTLFTIMEAAWNTPYINTDETLQLNYGMNKSEVLSVLGDPLYVKYGWPNGESNTIIWVYEVRSTEVASYTNVSYENVSGAVVLRKTADLKNPNGVIHDLHLIFNDNRLAEWNSIEKKKEIILSPDLPIPKAKKNWIIHPKISSLSSSYSAYNLSNTSSDLKIGLNIGKQIFGMNMGLDLTSGGVMFFIERNLHIIDLSVSFGEDELEVKGFNQNNVDGDVSEITLFGKGLKIGIFKDFNLPGWWTNYPLSIGLEYMSRGDSVTDGYVNGGTTYLTLKYRYRD